MAALFLLLLAVTGGVLIAELVVENPTADQITLFHHTLTGYSEGWLLAIAAGLGALITLLLVASLNATKARRVRRGQHRRRRRGLQHQVAAPEPDHTRLLEEFFGPEQPPPAPGWARQAGRPQGEGREGRAEADQSPVTVTPQWTGRHLEPLYEQVRSATSAAQARRAKQKTTAGWSCPHRNRSSTTLSRSTSRPGGRLAWTTTGSSRFRPARRADSSRTRGQEAKRLRQRAPRRG
jgi:hypothetical protein